MNRKILSWVMALCMILAIIPVPGVHDHALAEADHVHVWTQNGSGTYCTCSCGNRCSSIAVGVPNELKSYMNADGSMQVWLDRPCTTHASSGQGVKTPATMEEEPATCKEPSKKVYTADNYPDVTLVVTGTELADHDWMNYDGKCTVCEEQHAHTACGKGTCDVCNWYAAFNHPDNYPFNGHCDACGICLQESTDSAVGTNRENWWTMKSDETGHWQECNLGHAQDEKEEHKFDVNGACTECDYVAPKCEHPEGKQEYVSDGKGKHTMVCSICGENTLYNYYLNCDDQNPNDGYCDKCGYELYHYHSVGTPATCTKQAVCEICGEPYGEALGHEYAYTHIENTVYHKVYCSVCEEVIFSQWFCADEDNDHKCDKCGNVLSEHNFVAESDGNGKHTMKCDFCGITGTTSFCEDYTGDGLCDKCSYKLPVLPPHEHDYVSPMSNDDGTHTLSCNCGEKFTMNCGDYNGDRFCDSCGYEMMPPAPPHEHNYVAHNNNDGTHTLECNCGIAFDPMKCMDYSGDGLCDSCDYEMYHAGGTPTCTEQAICQNCGLPYGKTLPHTWQFNEEASTLNVEKKSFNIVIDCAECGKVYPIATNYNAKTEITQEGDCDTPELTKFSTSGSAWGVAFEIEKIVETKAATGEHNFEVVKSEPATCIMPAYYWYECTECDAEKNGEDPTGALAEHKYEVVKSEPANCIYPAYNWYECTVCGAEKNGEEGEATGIHVDGDNDYKCDVCGFVMGNPCDHEGKGTYTFTVEATCSAEGYVEVYCMGCEEVLSKKILEKNDNHVFYNGVCLLCGGIEEEVTCDHEGKGTYTFTIEATCSGEGLVQVICAACEDIISEETLEKNDNHVFYNGVCLLCGETDVCKHNYELVKEEPATCEVPAYYWYKCTECGDEMNGEDPTGALAEHKYEIVKTESATCEYPAYYWYECTVCGDEMNGEDPTGALAEHKYEVVKSEPANCIYPAYNWYECTVCGAEKNGEEGEATGIHVDGDNDYKCDVCGFVMGNPCDHEGKGTYTFTIEATCSAEGLVQVICAACEDIISEEILEKNDNHVFYNGVCLLCGETDECKHNYELVKEEPATCEYPAYYWYKCTECGEELNYEDKTGALAEHDYDVVREEAATCQYPAYKWYECTVCGAEKNGEEGEVNPNAHIEVIDEAVAATCTETGLTEGKKCSACGEVLVAQKEVAATGHSGQVTITPATCTEIGYGKGVCDICGETFFYQEIPVKGHTWDEGKVTTEPTIDAEGVKTFTCTACGETKTEAIEKLDHVHDYKAVVTAPDCNEAGYTTYTCECGDSYVADEVAALGHTEASANNAVAATCTTAGKEADTVCSVCGITISEGAAIAALGHAEETVAGKDATCTDNGLTAGSKCSVCGETVKAQEEIAAKGHSYTIHWEFNDAITEKYKVSTCTVCGHVHKEGPFECDH